MSLFRQNLFILPVLLRISAEVLAVIQKVLCSLTLTPLCLCGSLFSPTCSLQPHELPSNSFNMSSMPQPEDLCIHYYLSLNCFSPKYPHASSIIIFKFFKLLLNCHLSKAIQINIPTSPKIKCLDFHFLQGTYNF